MPYSQPARAATRRHRKPLAAATLIAILAVSGGCGSTAAPGTANHDAIVASHDKAVRFSQCMRANGVPAFPDPGASGYLTIDQVANGSSLNTSSPAWRQAIAACKGLEPAGFTGAKRTAGQQQAALRFAQCIRASGVPDFPDPTPNSPLVDTNRIPSSGQSAGMVALRLAMQKCRGAAAAAGVKR